MKKTVFIKNAAILTASSLILRFIGIVFKVWLARIIGSGGIGLYQMVFSVYVLAATFATSGICTAVTRLVADELALGTAGTVTKPVKISLKITLIIALLSVLILFFAADFIADKLLGDISAALSLRVLSLSLFFMGGCSCFKGYFIARSRALPPSLVQIFEQIIRIAVVFFAITKALPFGLKYACAAIFLGDTVAEASAFIILFVFYKKDSRTLCNLKGRSTLPYNPYRAIGHIAFPITLGRYLNSFLRTAENILVPKNLARFKGAKGDALSQFGMIKGMALPILLFPSTLLNSISTLLIPEISRESALGRKHIVSALCEKIIRLTASIGMLFGSLFFVCGEKIGFVIYGDSKVGVLLKALAPIVVLMYLDSVCDGLLKGLDQQSFTFKVTVADSTLRVIFVLALLPVLGLNGFIGIMYFSNIFTSVLNLTRLIKKSGAKPSILKCFFTPFILSAAVAAGADFLLKLIGNMPDLVYIILMCVISLPLYAAALGFTKVITTDDIRDMGIKR